MLWKYQNENPQLRDFSWNAVLFVEFRNLGVLFVSLAAKY